MAKFTDFNKLHTFIIAAEHLSFSKAAEQLFITQAAVSQQIRNLEEKLGFKLFHRVTRGLHLTKEGVRLFKVSRKSFAKVESLLELLAEDPPSGVLTVSTLPSLAMKWMIPRLERFNQKYPEINVHMHSHNELANFTTDGVDIAIRFGYKYGVESDLHSVFLMPEDVFLVASPQLLKDKPLKKTKDLRQHVLLCDEVDCHYDAYGVHEEIKWDAFAELFAIDLSKNRRITITGAHLVLQAAIEGQGVAMARTALVQGDLDSGRLVKLFDDGAMVPSPGYHIVYPKTSKNRKKIAVFEQWLLAEAANGQ